MKTAILGRAHVTSAENDDLQVELMMWILVGRPAEGMKAVVSDVFYVVMDGLTRTL